MLKFPGLLAGLTAGILIFLFFTIGFRFAGYTMPLSISLGILGGIACGLVVTWWHTEEIPIEVDKTGSELAKDFSPKVPAGQLKSLPKLAQSAHHSTGSSSSFFDWLFRKK